MADDDDEPIDEPEDDGPFPAGPISVDTEGIPDLIRAVGETLDRFTLTVAPALNEGVTPLDRAGLMGEDLISAQDLAAVAGYRALGRLYQLAEAAAIARMPFRLCLHPPEATP